MAIDPDGHEMVPLRQRVVHAGVQVRNASHRRAGERAVGVESCDDRKRSRAVGRHRDDRAVAAHLIRSPVEHDQLAVEVIERPNAKVAMAEQFGDRHHAIVMAGRKGVDDRDLGDLVWADRCGRLVRKAGTEERQPHTDPAFENLQAHRVPSSQCLEVHLRRLGVERHRTGG